MRISGEADPRPDGDGEEGRKRGRQMEQGAMDAAGGEKPMAAANAAWGVVALPLRTFALRGVERLGQGELGRFVGRGGARFDLVEPGEQFGNGNV